MATENSTGKNPFRMGFTIVISLLVAGFFMWLAVRGIAFDKIKVYFFSADYFWVATAAFFGLLAYGFRAVRWNLLLEPMGYCISRSNSFWAIAFGYLINLTIPRSGELARATALYGVEKVPVDVSFGTIILERVVDLLCMGIFLGLVLILKYDAVLVFYNKSGFDFPWGKFGYLALGSLGAFIFFYRFKNRLKGLPFLGKVVDFIEGIVGGVLSIFSLKRPWAFVLYSLSIWICYYLAAYLVCFSLEETSNFGIADGFYIIVVGTLGMMVPASGGMGAFHLALKLGIGALYISMGKAFEDGQEVGLAYAFISHTMQLIIMIFMGIVAIPMLAKAKNKQKI